MLCNSLTYLSFMYVIQGRKRIFARLSKIIRFGISLSDFRGDENLQLHVSLRHEDENPVQRCDKHRANENNDSQFCGTTMVCVNSGETAEYQHPRNDRHDRQDWIETRVPTSWSLRKSFYAGLWQFMLPKETRDDPSFLNDQNEDENKNKHLPV